MDDESRKLAEELLSSDKPKPSFGKSLFFGVFDNQKVIPFPKVSKEEMAKTEAKVQELKSFMDKNLDPIANDKNGSIPEEVILGLGKLGMLSLTIPQEYGGLGMSQYAYCRTMEEVARRCAATALFINAHQSVGLKALLLFGTKEQKNKWLPPLGRGEVLAAFSLTEANAGSDAGGIETTAVYNPEKKTYSIKGRKQWTTNGSIAKILTVMAKTNVKGQEKVTAFLATPDMPGFSVLDAALDKVGMRGSTTSNLQYDNVEVPEENILGPLGGGLRVCLTVLDYGRTTFGATCTGIAKECVEKAYKHALSRYQFKKPLASFGLVKEKLSKMSAYLYAMEASTYLTAGLVDKGQDDVMLESAILKVFNSDSSWKILYDTMQIFGGRSFFTDLPFERMMRDARLNMIGEGSNEVLRVFIAVVGLREAGLSFKKGAGIYSQIKNSLFKPTIAIKNFPDEAGALEKRVRKFAYLVLRVLGKYREGVIEKQLELNRIADMAIALYTSTAVLAKLENETDSKNVVAGRLYLLLAQRFFDQRAAKLFSPDDEVIEQTADFISGLKE